MDLRLTSTGKKSILKPTDPSYVHGSLNNDAAREFRWKRDFRWVGCRIGMNRDELIALHNKVQMYLMVTNFQILENVCVWSLGRGPAAPMRFLDGEPHVCGVAGC
jgi:hypothetical protein